MALTATAQSALPLEWDETIVPALRKREFYLSHRQRISASFAVMEPLRDAVVATLQDATCAEIFA